MASSVIVSTCIVAAQIVAEVMVRAIVGKVVIAAEADQRHDRLTNQQRSTEQGTGKEEGCHGLILTEEVSLSN